MKWIYLKENDQCSIFLQKKDEEKTDFSYIEMIKELYMNRRIAGVEFEGDFTDEEKESVQTLIQEINKHTQEFFEK